MKLSSCLFENLNVFKTLSSSFNLSLRRVYNWFYNLGLINFNAILCSLISVLLFQYWFNCSFPKSSVIFLSAYSIQVVKLSQDTALLAWFIEIYTCKSLMKDIVPLNTVNVALVDHMLSFHQYICKLWAHVMIAPFLLGESQ